MSQHQQQTEKQRTETAAAHNTANLKLPECVTVESRN